MDFFCSDGGHGKRTEFCTHTTTDTKQQQQQQQQQQQHQKEPWIKHSEIIDLLERKFRGGKAWFLIDCCHSGGFGEAIMERLHLHSRHYNHHHHHDASLAVEYGCIMSTPAAAIAGEEWTITECFIRAFKGELSCSRISGGDGDNDGNSDAANDARYYLSIKPPPRK